ncbi:hypothetical protein ACXYMO_14600 [Arenibacterium sp. CAU 1754]
MADRALTEDAVLAGLQDIRLPADAAGGALAEGLAAVGLGICLAVLLGLILRQTAFSRTRPARSAAAGGPSPDDIPQSQDARRMALLRELKQRRPSAYDRLRARIYQPGGLPDIATLEAEVRRDD